MHATLLSPNGAPAPRLAAIFTEADPMALPPAPPTAPQTKVAAGKSAGKNRKKTAAAVASPVAAVAASPVPTPPIVQPFEIIDGKMQYVGEAGPDYPAGQRYCSTLLVKPNKVTDNIRYSSCCGYDHKKKLRASLICQCGRCFCVSCITPLLDSSSGALAPGKWNLSSVSKFFQDAGAIFECPECATCLQCLKPYALEAEDAPSPSQCVQCLEWRCHTCKDQDQGLCQSCQPAH